MGDDCLVWRNIDTNISLTIIALRCLKGGKHGKGNNQCN
jgi:hypothetical protein